MDLLDFRWRPTGTNVQMPQIEIQARLVRSGNQSEEIEDITGVRRILFPNILQNLSAAERDELVDEVAMKLIDIYRARRE